MRFSNKLLLIFSSFLMISSFAFAETFRVGSVHIINLEENPEFEKTADLHLSDALAIQIPENRPYLEAIELKIEIPEGIALWRDCTGFYVYDHISPSPTKEQIDYSGTKVYFGVLPSRLSWIVQIPLVKNYKSKTNQYITNIDRIPETSNNSIFVRLLQIMKGIPDDVEASEIPVTVKPILADKGLLDIKFSGYNWDDPDNEPNPLEESTVFIDEDMVIPYSELQNKQIMLETGIHNISIISSEFRTEVRTVRIDQAKTTELEIVLKSVEPSLLLQAPSGTKVYFDDEEYEFLGIEKTISEGDHKIKFMIGDYELVRNLSATNGKTYTVDLNVDIKISEE